jgi:hypothetical protein
MAGESIVETYLVNRVEETGGESRKLKWLCRRHAPDRWVMWQFPRCAFIEVKALGEKPTPGQMREHERLRARGYKVYVVDTKEKVDAVITKILSERVT